MVRHQKAFVFLGKARRAAPADRTQALTAYATYIRYILALHETMR